MNCVKNCSKGYPGMAWFAAAKAGAEAKVMSVSSSLHVLADSGAALQRRRNMQQTLPETRSEPSGCRYARVCPAISQQAGSLQNESPKTQCGERPPCWLLRQVKMASRKWPAHEQGICKTKVQNLNLGKGLLACCCGS